MDGIVRRLPVKGADGSIDLIEIEGIFYLEARGENTLVRTKRKKPYKSLQRLGELGKKLPAPAFVRCHREYIVNLNRVRLLTSRNSEIMTSAWIRRSTAASPSPATVWRRFERYWGCRIVVLSTRPATPIHIKFLS